MCFYIEDKEKFYSFFVILKKNTSKCSAEYYKFPDLQNQVKIDSYSGKNVIVCSLNDDGVHHRAAILSDGILVSFFIGVMHSDGQNPHTYNCSQRAHIDFGK